MLDKFEIYIKNVKKKFNPKYVSVFFFFVFGLVAVFGMDAANNFKRQKDLVQNEYNRTLYEMVGYIKNFELQLNKLQVTTSNTLKTTTLADIWRQSNLAKENLANLPILQDNLSNTSKFLTQLSDYSYYLMKQTSKEIQITKEENDNIIKLTESSTKLLEIANNIFNNLNSGSLKWDEVEKLVDKNLDQELEESGIPNISKTFQDYEGLIYDGAYSNHILNIKPKLLKDNIVDSEYGKQYLEKIFDEYDIVYKGESNNVIDLLEYTATKDNVIKNIQITKKEGLLYSVLSDRKVAEQKLTPEDCEKQGLEFLSKLNIDNMKSTYYVITDNLITINYASTQNNVLIYSDLIKIKITTDTGEIMSYESTGYVFNHIKRDNITPKLKLEDCKKKLSSDLKIESEQLCIIPTESKNELLVYEYKCKLEDKTYLIYINTNTGEEEKILLLLDVPGGTLTM